MEVISGRSSSVLNPDAPLFVPSAYRTVEDFSEQWWELVKSSAWFRDYWLKECFSEEPQIDSDDVDNNDPALPDVDNNDPALPDIDAFLSDGCQQYHWIEEEEKKRCSWDVIAWGADKWRGTRNPMEGPKYTEKAPKIVNVKVSPRMIQQPR